MKPQVGQIYQYHKNPSKIILVTHYCDDRKTAMTKGLTPDTKSGWRSALALQHWWTPVTQETK